MTVKEELHALVERLPEPDAEEALEYLRARIEPTSRPRGSFIDESRRALDETMASGGSGVPHAAVRAWLKTWGTPAESAAEEAIGSLEQRGGQKTSADAGE